MGLIKAKIVFSLFFLATALLITGLVLAFLGQGEGNYGLQSKNIERIISLGPVITEEIYLLQADDKLVADTIYCTKPEEAKNKQKIGTVLEIGVEKIIMLKPDIVFATSLSNTKQCAKLMQAGIRVVTFMQAGSFPEICENFLILARYLSKEDKAQEIISNVKKEVEYIKKKMSTVHKKKIFFQIGANPLFTVSRDSFINDFIDFSGGLNIAADTTTGSYSREQVIMGNPDIIIIATMGIMGQDEKKQWQNFQTINAVKNNAIFFMDSYLTCSPTPITFITALKEMIAFTHPEVKIDDSQGK